ncbi:hypothetical protein Rhe02_84360 [Rhizocola hellebori]|uniref:Uncharacterized protein n=1 Tax=Rhizocola hellebori TaxID=1392758 RepID=A0A8J3QII0_9ACTN|nr:hypothetical protein [Rhizocola hellebori]GIH10369.1 hypothetical protein Rhe02_84360 [Rhizocola hellebori]
MGVLYDYFRAADDATVLELMEKLEGGPIVTGEGTGVDAIDFKGIDPGVALGQLVAFALNVPWDVDLVSDELVWPSEEEAEEGEGAIVTRLPDSVRDVLAAITPDQVPQLAQQWVGIEEFAGYDDTDEEFCAGGIEEVAGLAQRARDHGEHLYCWCSL